jgi:GTP:adenosylcobinamide-phosphate guanylyltransferase
VLAAGEDHARLERMSGTPYRALIDVAGQPMVQRVLAALRGATRVGRIAVVAPNQVQERLPAGAADLALAPGATLLDNVMRGISALADGKMVLFVHADAPLVTAEAIDDFLTQAEPLEPDLAYAIVSKREIDKRFPAQHRTYAHLREGSFTGTNVVLVNADFILRHQALVRDFYKHRKNPLRLAGLLGPGLALRLLTGTLSIAHLEHRITQALGGKARAIISRYPELAFDVDKPADLETLRDILGQ